MSAIGAMRKVATLTGRDLLSESRARQVAPVMAFFALSLVFLFTFALPTGAIRAPAPPPVAGAVPARDITGTLLWATVFFSAVIGLGRGASVDREAGAAEGLLLAPVDPAALFAAKVVANFLFLTVTAALVIPMFVLLAGAPADLLFPEIVLVAIPANIGLAAVGTLFATAAQFSEARSVMLPLLAFPFCLPVVLAASRLTSTLLITGAFASEMRWFILLTVFDVVFLTIGTVTYEFVIRE
ncbi:MAG: heme exporter protein CcmB [Actinomycetota bacterium]